MTTRPVWLVRLTEVSAEWAQDERGAALNCHVDADVTGLTVDEIHVLSESEQKQYARELYTFVNHIGIGDLVVGVVKGRPKLLVGLMAGDYERLAAPVNGCRHKRAIDWRGDVRRDEISAAGVTLPKQWVRAVGELAVTEEALVLLQSVVAGDKVPVTQSSSLERTEPARTRPRSQTIAASRPETGRRLVLSRKGFDDGSGGCPSPVLPDGALFSMPIPEEGSGIRYSDLRVPGIGRTAYELLTDLGRRHLVTGGRRVPLSPMTEAHLDPDLNADAADRAPGWRPIFGQAASAASHLVNEGVGVGDLFLFFGSYRRTDWQDGRVRWGRRSASMHVLWGWMEIGEVWQQQPDGRWAVPDWASRHPHIVQPDARGNTIYVAAESLSADDAVRGAGVFSRYDDELRLSRVGLTSTSWCLPAAFRGVERLTFHDPASWTECDRGVHLKSASRGQEFVTDMSAQIEAWAVDLIRTHSVKSRRSAQAV